MSRTVLVTGGGGFIGTWVLKTLLAEGARPVAYDIAPGGERWQRILGASAADVAFEPGDLLDDARLAGVFARHEIDSVIHLAAWLTPPCQADPYRGCEIDVLGTMKLFELLRRVSRPVRGFAYASSVAVYGPEAGDASLAPTSKQALPETFYGAFKKACELIAAQYWLHFKIPSVGLRPLVVYGPGREHGLTAGPTLAARAAARGETYHFGFSGTTGLDYVEDTARAFCRCALEVSTGCYAVDMPGTAVSMDEVIALLDKIRPGCGAGLSIDGPHLPYPVTPDEYPIQRLFPDWKNLPVADGLRRTVDYYSQGL